MSAALPVRGPPARPLRPPEALGAPEAPRALLPPSTSRHALRRSLRGHEGIPPFRGLGVPRPSEAHAVPFRHVLDERSGLRACGNDQDAFESFRADGGRSRSHGSPAWSHAHDMKPSAAEPVAPPARARRGIPAERGFHFPPGRRKSVAGRPAAASSCRRLRERHEAKVRQGSRKAHSDGAGWQSPDAPASGEWIGDPVPRPRRRAALAVDGRSGFEGAGNAERRRPTGDGFERPGCRARHFRANDVREIAGEARLRGFPSPGGRLSHRSERVIGIRKSRTMGHYRNAENRRIRPCAIYTRFIHELSTKLSTIGFSEGEIRAEISENFAKN